MAYVNEKEYNEIAEANPFLSKQAIMDYGNEYGLNLTLNFDVDGKMPFIRCKVNFLKILENQYSINVQIETGNHLRKVMHLPPFHRLGDAPSKKDLTDRVTEGIHEICFQNAAQPKIIFLDDFDLRHLWEFSNSRKVCH